MNLKYFSYTTDTLLSCPCCGEPGMNPQFMARVDALRGHIGFPLVVSSGYRCPDWNDRISTTGRYGPHTTGAAIDFQVYGSRALVLVEAMLERGFMGIGIHQRGPRGKRFIHGDTLPPAPGRPRPWLWTY